MLIVTSPEFSTAPAAGLTTEVDWALSVDGEMVMDHGQCVATLLPHDTELVLVLPPRAVSWHRVVVPKVPQAKLRAVLEGILEERVLSDTTELHFAVEPGARPGQTLWVAVCDKEWLIGWLQTLERAGRPVSRVVPALWPLNPLTPPTDPNGLDLSKEPTLHWAYSEADQIWLATASPMGVRCTPLRESVSSTFGESSFGGASSAAGTPPSIDIDLTNPPTTSWLADPSVAAVTERALGRRFELVSRPSWLLQCALSDWNLAQFDLSQSAAARRGQRLRRTMRRWRSAPSYRAARWGLGALLAVHLVGLNVAAWREHSALDTKKAAVTQTLQQTFPQVTLVVDAPVQMRRELSLLLKNSGTLSASDLETQLAAVAAVSGEAQTIPTAISYADEETRLGGWRGPPELVESMAQTLSQSGWRARVEGNDLLVSPAPP